MKEQYNRDGYVILPDFFDPSDIDKIREEAKSIFHVALEKKGLKYKIDSDEAFTKAVFELFKVSYNDFLGAAKAAQHIISMHQLAVSEKLISLLYEIGIKKPIICVKPIIYFNSKYLAKIDGHYKTPAHQDWRSMQGSLNSVVVWVPLVDINIDLGAVEFIKGSHLTGLLGTDADEWFRHVNSDQIKETDFIPAQVKKGDVVLFSAFTVHRSGNNITDKIRWSMHFRFNDMLEPTFSERGFPHPYIIYRPQQEIISNDFPSTDQLKNIFNA